MSIIVTVNGQSGPSVVASTGDTVVANITAASAVSVTASPAAAPGGVGPTGPQGPPSTTITVGNVSALSAGSSPTVVGTSSNNGANLTLAFGIPAGATGSNGITPTISVSASTLSAGSSATVAATTSNGGANVALAFGIPQGAAGAGGSNLTLSDTTPANLGTAAAGTSNLVARADHVHSLPAIAYANLSGVPANFPTNTTLVTGLNSSYSGINHGHNYVTGLNNLTGNLTLAAGSNVSLAVANSTLTISSTGGGITANDSIDGGDYVGEILGGITFATQPQSQTLTAATTLNLSNQITPTVPSSGTLHSVASLGNQLIATASRSGSSGGMNFAVVDLVKSSNNGTSFSQELEVMREQSYSIAPYIVPTTALTFASNGSRTVFTDGYDGLRYFDGGGSIASATGRITPLGAASHGVAYLASAGRFVSISDTRIASSSDGVSWTQRLSASSLFDQFGELVVNRFVFAIGSRFVVLTANAETYSRLYHSTDGVTWTTVNRSYGYVSAASNGSRIVAARGGTSTVDYSTDGLTWTTVSLPVPVSRVSHAAGLFWAFPGTAGTDLLTSPDGVTWTLRDLPSEQAISSTAAAAGSNVAFLLGYLSKAFQATLSTAAASANLTVSASTSSGNPVSYQWQSSLDAGTTWANVANATTSTLSLTGITAANTGTRYRAAASATGAATQYSQSATLTITG